MKRFLTWTAAVAVASVTIVYINKALQRGRARVKEALGQAEAVAGETRAALEQAESALHSARTAI